jgi:NAD(P)-dependent dehydrogenase (short-subunit alcohol dehydrogenase family)
LVKRTNASPVVGGVSGRSALVIGGSRGLGRAVALALAESGASVLAVGRDPASLAELGAIARARGLAIATSRADVSRAERIRPLLDRAGGPDLLVVAAGDYWEGPIARLTVDRWKALVDSNVTLALGAMREALPGMRRRRFGRILLFGVAGAETPRAAPRAHAYRAAKTALLSLARSIAHEEASNGITVNVILPGVIQTGIAPRRAAALARKIPAGRLGAPSEIARAALFLLAEESGYITGAALAVSGGYLL